MRNPQCDTGSVPLAASHRRTVLPAALAALVALTAPGCARPSSIPDFTREQEAADTLPAEIAQGEDVDLASMRLLADAGGRKYYLAQDTVPGSPAVCAYLVAQDPDHNSWACGTMPLYFSGRDIEVVVLYAADETPGGYNRIAANLAIVDRSAESNGGGLLDRD